jgi:hypothetical protein
MDNHNQDYELLQKLPAFPLKRKSPEIDNSYNEEEFKKLKKRIDNLERMLYNLEQTLAQQGFNLRRMKNTINQEKNEKDGNNHR